jgi:hypothetical protein
MSVTELDLTPPWVNMALLRGDSPGLSVTVKADLTGFTVLLQAREDFDSPTPLVSMQNGNGITVTVISPTETKVVFRSLTNSEAAAISALTKKPVYDWEISNSLTGYNLTIWQGYLSVAKDVARLSV